MLLTHIKASGLLSFGPKGIDLPMRRLNVLIGPNGCGKSNLLEIINLFKEAPSPKRSLSGPIDDSGGIREWIWQGEILSLDSAAIECLIVGITMPLRHYISFGASGNKLVIADELVEMVHPTDSEEDWWFYRGLNKDHKGRAAFHDSEMVGGRNDGVRYVPHDTFDSSASILSQVRDPGRYKVFEYLEHQYSSMELYRNWCFGPQASMRKPARSDERQDRLSRSGQNLAVVVAAMSGAAKKQVIAGMQSLYPGIQDLHVRPVAGGSLQLYLEEESGIEVSTTRLSDGTLRYLSLLVILLDPNPPPLIAIEEPELGLHPDVLPELARLLHATSERTQLVITTHSRTLVDCLQDDPESVIVCEKHDGESVFERLDVHHMKVWLEKYTLGELWSKGELGGEPLVKVKLYIEGGGNNPTLDTEFRAGWTSFFDKAGLAEVRKLPKIIRGGGRDQTFDAYCTAVRTRKPEELPLLLVDSEELVQEGHSAWDHLHRRDGWEQPAEAKQNDVFLMIACMETWFVADREALRRAYHGCWRDGALPQWPNLAEVEKERILGALMLATAACDHRRYAKGQHSFRLLKVIDPVLVQERCPFARELVERLRQA